MRYLGFVLSAVLLAAAIAAALLAADVHAWQRTLSSDDALVQVSAPSTHLPASLSERVLAVDDDRALRRALILYRRNGNDGLDLTSAITQSIRRSKTEAALEAVVKRGADARTLAQVQTLLGVLAYGDFARGNRDPSQTAAATGMFQGALQADPTAEDAKYNLELLFRIFSRRGVGTSFSNQSSPGSQGRRGAGAGAPGSGY